ncbi:exosortase F system-associated membrane protein [Chryseobacterium sp. M5A1_1a]
MKILNWLLVISGICGLIGIRILEEKLFYDPFLGYFHEANKNIDFPVFEWGKLILGYLFRFSLNLLFSCLIIQGLFKNKQWTLQGAVMMLIVFTIALSIYLYCIHNHFEIGYLFSFYMRRFVIQPLIILLIIPMFYYRRKMVMRE